MHCPFKSRLPSLLCVLCLWLFLPAASLAAQADSFRTPEYRASTGLESIGAADAYALGFSGSGVVVGVVDDSFAPGQGEFEGKYPYGRFGGPGDPFETHGIHVSGILAARKNGLGMHGVAYDAKLLPWLYTGANGFQGWPLMLQYPELRIVSNSWAVSYHLDSIYRPDFWDDAIEAFEEEISLAADLVEQDKLIIMGAANDGHLAPSFVAGLPSVLDRQGEDNPIGLNWLNVSAYDPAHPASHPAFVWPSTNLGQGASEYTLMAPGVDINSTVSAHSYAKKSGTSMATPYVAGVAALVQQAFPYMGGKQLADTLLSTATPVTGADQPRYFVLMRDDYDDDQNHIRTEIIAYSTAPVSASDEEKAAIMAQLDIYSPWDTESTANLLDAALAAPSILSADAYNELFGQGMVNAARAVQGPGHFNAKRLDPVRDLAANSFGDGRNYAMYGVNTQGFDSLWSNDIGERRADAGALAGLGVGLRKDGDGVLYMTGANSYTGPTEVRGGGICLGTAQNYASASLAGDVHVRDSGLFTGAGRVGGSLYSTGILAPGLESVPGSALEVGGGVTSSGVLRLALGQNGLANSMTARAMNLSGGALQIVEAPGHEIEPYANYYNVLSAPGGISGLEALPARIVFSPFLSYSLMTTGNTSVSLIASTNDLDSLPGLPAQTRKVAGALQHMFNGLHGKPLQDQLDFLYSQSAGDFEETASAMRGDVQAATLTSLPFTGMLQRLVASNPLGPGSPPADNDPQKFSPSLGPGPGAVNIWMRPLAGYSSTDGQSSLRQDAVFSRMRGLAAGLQRDAEDFYGGVLFAFGDSEVEQGRDEADIIDARIGLYGGYNPGGLRLTGLVSGGWQHYKTSRRVPTATGRDYLKSRFDGYSLGFGGEASYNLLHGFSETFAVSPYAGFDADYIRQEDRRESGSELFALDIDGKDYWRTAARPGLRLDYAPVEWLTVTASGGYKRLLSGHRPTLDVGFKADSSYRFSAVGADEGRDFVTYELGVEAALPRNIKLAARFFGENSERSRSYTGYVNMIFEW